ncbi:XRE family transcriptional regulator [bacterium]|nr:MAG: XRE family transcriptional regulator [bacterium]
MRLISNVSDIGAVLRDRRKELGKSAAAVSEALGIPRSTLARVESGRTSPSWGLVLGLSQALDLQPVLVPRERMTAVETVVKMSDAPETPPLAGEEW